MTPPAGNSPDPWLRVETSRVWLAQDRVKEALATARQARDIRPKYLPEIMAEIDALLRLREDRQALYLAREHVTRVQSPHLAACLVELCVARGDLEDALEALQIAEFYGRHAEPPFQQWLLDRR